MENTLEGIKSRLDGAGDRISDLEDKIEKKTCSWGNKTKKDSKRMKIV